MQLSTNATAILNGGAPFHMQLKAYVGYVLRKQLTIRIDGKFYQEERF